MNFTREPIIETVIMPREGCKLLVRSSKGTGQEEYTVESLEVVSFGHSFFFRSQERSKAFLVPVSDYEVLELKEVRVNLKNAAPDRSIKIGGGRDHHPKASRDESEVEAPRPPERAERGPDRGPDRSPDRKRDRRRRGRRGRHEGNAPEGSLPESSSSDGIPPEASGEEVVKAPSFISKLFPPPTTLIKETLGRYKAFEEEAHREKPPLDPEASPNASFSDDNDVQDPDGNTTDEE